MEDRLLTTREAAELLAVGPTSVKRWADAGVLPCVKTAGGHRRFDIREVRKFLQGPMGEETEPAETTTTSRVSKFVDLLVESKNLHAITSHLLSERGRLGSWWQVAMVVGEVLVEIGHLWEDGDLTVLEEHIASERLDRAITTISTQLTQSPRAPRCLLVMAPEDEHTLGLSLAELCARELDWQTVWAGRDTPVPDVLEVLKDGTIDVVIVSASIYSNTARELRQIAQDLSKVARKSGTKLLFGGMGAWPKNPSYGERVNTFEELHEHLARR